MKLYLYHITSTDFVKIDCIEEFLTIAPNQKAALKRFKEELDKNNDYIDPDEKTQYYRKDWWDIERYDLKDGLTLKRFGESFIERADNDET